MEGRPLHHKHLLFLVVGALLLFSAVGIALNATQESLQIQLQVTPTSVDQGQAVTVEVSSYLGSVLILSIPTTVEIHGPGGIEESYQPQTGLSGSYHVEYTPEEPGVYTIYAKVLKDGETHVKQTTFTVGGAETLFTVDSADVVYLENGQAILSGALLLQNSSDAVSGDVDLYLSPKNLPFYRELCTVQCKGACQFSCPVSGGLELGPYEILDSRLSRPVFEYCGEGEDRKG